jgi:REP element-mobilizing transposase RayT
MKYNPDLHHRRSIRLRDYNYANTGAYFVTVCCQNREFLFGEIINGKMILNEYGNIAKNTWNELPQHHFNIKLGEFIVMPDHIHGILEIIAGVAGNAPTGHMMTDISPKPGTLSTIIRSYKSSVSKQIHDHNRVGALPATPPSLQTPYVQHNDQIVKNAPIFANTLIWQRNYHEHIIRNETEYAKIANYIKNNPISQLTPPI